MGGLEWGSQRQQTPQPLTAGLPAVHPARIPKREGRVWSGSACKPHTPQSRTDRHPSPHAEGRELLPDPEAAPGDPAHLPPKTHPHQRVLELAGE